MSLIKIGLLSLLSILPLVLGQAYAQSTEQTPDLPTNTELLYSLYLIGDAGDDTTNSMPVLSKLHLQLQASDKKNTGVVFLGDNIYPKGLRKKKSEHRAEDEIRLNAQLDIVKDFEGDVVFLTGNHDWKKYDKGGLKAVKRQEKYIENYLDRKEVFLPSNGCPGPEVVKLSPGLVMIIIDTQWWLHPFEKSSGLKDDCQCRNEAELMVLFKDLLKKYRHQHIIVAGHHPLYSNGTHGGYFQFKDHLFPLTHINESAYLPLPIIGSIYPGYRKFIGHNQDLAHPVYNDMVFQISEALKEYEDIVYTAGHEHNLQYHHKENIHHIISGSGSKTSYIKNNIHLGFGSEQRGYSRLLYYKNGELWLEFYTINPSDNSALMAFRKMLFKKKPVVTKMNAPVSKKSYKNQWAQVVPDSTLAASAFKRFFQGDLNRDLWTTPLKVPYLDIHYEKGGLNPIKKGGGQQTISLRMEGADGKEYTLRGVKKNTRFLVEKELRGTIAQDVIYDGMAGSHPYGAVSIPELSKAAGVYHSNPRLVYVPKDSILGDYLDEFGGMFCLFEERPDGDMSDAPSFGNSEKVRSYTDAIRKMQAEYDHVVDKNYNLKARLFDMTIGDWDRHDDQWRWATFKTNDKVIYRAIPRDRDQAYFTFDGVLPSIVNRKWLMRKFQSFDSEVRDIAGLNFNARYFDRAFLIEASKSDWLRNAEELKANLSDESIEKSIHALPPEAFAVNGDKIISTLKARRDQLPQLAEQYYDILAKTVSIPGTLGDDYFEIIRHEGASLELNIYPRKKGKKVKKKRYYHRVFNADETQEVQLYGLDGEDEYQLKGVCDKSVLVRIIAGPKEDKIEDNSVVKGLKKHTLVYDSKGKNKVIGGADTKLKTVKDSEAYDYDRKAFKYDKLLPLASLGYNADDGFYIGPGFKYTKHGFKKEPYKYYHKALANYAFNINGLNLYYNFDYTKLVGNFNLEGNVRINLPDVYQYYGDTDYTDIDFDSDEYNVKMNDYHLNLNLKLRSDDQTRQLRFGLLYLHINFEELPTFVGDSWQTQSQNYLAPAVEYKYENLSNVIHPYRGIKFYTRLLWNHSINNNHVEYLHLNTALSFYQPLNISSKQTTLALRSGYVNNFGSYAFYQSNFVDGIKNFRGVRRNRFSSKAFFYQNVDVRMSLLRVPNYIAPFDWGLLGHFDLIRMWQADGIDDKWHHSYGFGTFISILDAFMLKGTFSISENDELFVVGTSFLF
ncbi:metallophosphoesterase [Carboxylicivirga sp. M1479]|uniref:metallophosphoesterase n=1 Tax=Carboxylicivirga sp. M1479 TaxID=2594476 RepID=UPI001177614E|nr:metallophosphoesterase [Carboxylicivirga sp. M1479]TRX70205.1 hypothetical protein FNN09_12015 [Carboxylicivirga sp. M1479]